MIKVIQLDDSGAETAVIELDDFLVETVYSGLACMLRDAASTHPSAPSLGELSRQARQRRAKILTRLNG
jgi:hypothetical protein